ncbi:MAG: type VI secretion system ATPase TssH [Gammaproteobacteria bacterium]|nr:MAG: type VI secretion system ATPase TssH [Gammaproteobacteria bacterium]
MKAESIRALLERLDDRMARALERAAEVAVRRSHLAVAPEHWLVALLEDEGSGMAAALERLGVDVEALGEELFAALGRKRGGQVVRPALSPALWQWLEAAGRVPGSIDGARLLACLLELAPSLEGAPFARLAAADIRPPVVEPMAPTNGVEALQAGRSARADEALERFTVDLTAQAQAGQLDPVLGRDEEIRMMLDILCRRRKNNPILVGEPGVGKTALIEGLALRIAGGAVPPELRDTRIRVLDLGLLQAGAGMKGEFEQRLQDVLEAVRQAEEEIILFIDEAHTLIGAGGEAGGSDAANLLKPALARGEIRAVAATTWAEYKRYFERDAALERRFQLVKVEEPDIDTAILMLMGLKERYQQHHRLPITDEAIEAAVRLSARYINGRQLPDKAIDLLDTACARVRMGQVASPAALERAQARIQHLRDRLAQIDSDHRRGVPVDERLRDSLEGELAEAEAELEALEARWDEERILVTAIREHGQGLPALDGARLETELERARRMRRALAATQGGEALLHPEVDASTIASVVSDWTGVPLGRMVEDELGVLLELEQRLGERIIGQDAALALLARGMRNARARLGNPQAPMGVFLFAGPSGVGKTETAHALADILFGGERYLVTINMSEYQEAHTVSQLKGSPPGYVGYGEGGVLTEAVRQRPYSVVLLDEIEKAHPDVLNLFYQVFDRGFMRDGEGREIDFRNTVIIMTSNLGSETLLQLLEQDDEAGHPAPAALVEAIRPDLERHLAPALLGRMQIVPFLPLDEEILRGIVALRLEALAERLGATHGVELCCEESALAALAARCQAGNRGARQVGTWLEQNLLPGMARSLLAMQAEGDLPQRLWITADDAGEIELVFTDGPAQTEPAETPAFATA